MAYVGSSPMQPLAAVGLTALLLAVALLIFITARHIQLITAKRRRNWPISTAAMTPPTTGKDDYFLFVLGSGGHTKEMLMMMDDGFCNFRDCHRRYLISSGDRMSENHLADYEDELGKLSAAEKRSSGTYDKKIVTRARRVHQPLWSTPFSALRSVVDILPVLLSPPSNATGQRRRIPTRVFSNGPATGFFVALVIHLLKIFYMVPEQSMQFVYIESWARISTLSVTGKLLYHTRVADSFYVQHQALSSKYGILNAGEMVFNARRPDV